MKALVIEQFGNPSVFKEIDLKIPDLLPQHVLIQVAATSVNPVDYKIRQNDQMLIPPNLRTERHSNRLA